MSRRLPRWFPLAAVLLGLAIGLPAVGVLSMLPLWFPFGKDKGDVCDIERLSMLSSPDDAWVMVVDEYACSGQSFATSGVTDVVQLFRKGEKPTRSNDVFALNESGHPEYRPQVRWISPQKLEITAPVRSLIGLRKRSYENIEIALKFDPDDPIERARFLKEVGLPPD